jgi:phosphoserine phosphatase RsbU/P
LVITGLLALALFFWYYSMFHPLSVSDSDLNEKTALELSGEKYTSLGYNSDFDPKVRYMVNSRLLDSLQTGTDLNEFYSNGTNRRLFPVFYWESSFFAAPATDGNPMADANRPTRIRLELSESGELLALHNPGFIMPSARLNRELLNGVLGYEIRGEAPSDSLLNSRILFRFDDDIENEPVQPVSSRVIDLNERSYLDRSVAESIASYYLDQSGWSNQGFQPTDAETIAAGEAVAARVTFSRTGTRPDHPSKITATVLPSGELLSLTYNILETESNGVTYSQLMNNIRGGMILLGVFWVLILFIIRFRMRLIDMKAAILVAVLAGFILPFIIVSTMVYEYVYDFGSYSFPYLLTLLLILGVSAAPTSVLYFMVTSISDSIAREKWATKLRTVDLLRTGYFSSRPVGLALVRGTLYSFVICGIWALLFGMIPGSYLSVDSVFNGSGSYLPNIVMVLGNLLWYLIVAEAIFLILLSYIRSYTKSVFLIVLFTGVIFALMNPLVIDVGPYYAELILLGFVGLAAGLIYKYEDFFTVFITLFFTAGFLYSAPGWLVEQSPDSSIFYTQIILTVGAFIFGGYAIKKGKTNKDLPEFVPEYIEELAQEERIKQELQIARKVQQSFLPDSTPDFQGIDIAAICKPAYETGGDYYDFIELDNDRLAVTIGDVSGKGIQAAFYMTFTKGVLHALCDEFRSTIEVLAKTNTLFRRNANKGTFVSLIFGVVDLNKNSFRFSRAGHNPLLYYSSRDKKLHEYAPLGIGLGMAEKEIFSKNIIEQTITLSKDDLLIMFTDGVVEATSSSDSFYGDERLHNLIKANHHLSAEDLMHQIMADLESFSDGANQHDDMTMLIIKKQ